MAVNAERSVEPPALLRHALSEEWIARIGRLQDALALAQPGAREIVVAAEIDEMIPFVVDAVDARLIGTVELLRKLEIVGRVGKHEVDRLGGQLCQLFQAIADQDHIAPKSLPLPG